jgi:hypothetical protein
MAKREPNNSSRHTAGQPRPRIGIGRAWLRTSTPVFVIAGMAILLSAVLSAPSATEKQGLQFLWQRPTGPVLLVCGVSLLVIAVYYQMVSTRKAQRRRRAPRTPRAAPPSSDRPYSDRLSQYLAEEPQPAIGANESWHRSPMAFFMAYLPGPRRGPKSPSTIRAILLRIQRLIRGDI